MNPVLLNLGCGRTIHPDWINLDVVPLCAGVRSWDLRRPLPFAPGACDAVYTSHLLEHLRQEDGLGLLGEIHRVLKPAGVVRVVVPDLESIVRAWLETLGEAGNSGSGRRAHQWMGIELLDQMVRDTPGGAMASWLKNPGEQREFITGRVGEEVLSGPPPGTCLPPPLSVRVAQVLKQGRGRMVGSLVRILGGRSLHAAWQEGWFRSQGEVHRWMYDRISLTQALEDTGFSHPKVVAWDQSAILGFLKSGLDDRDGGPRKPDSLYMEATRP